MWSVQIYFNLLPYYSRQLIDSVFLKTFHILHIQSFIFIPDSFQVYLLCLPLWILSTIVSNPKENFPSRPPRCQENYLLADLLQANRNTRTKSSHNSPVFNFQQSVRKWLTVLSFLSSNFSEDIQCVIQKVKENFITSLQHCSQDRNDPK